MNLASGPSFPLDFAFGSEAGGAPLDQLFPSCVQPLVDGCLSGFNATILAFGQTGSGKTHTMGTAAGAAQGVVPAAVARLFASAVQRADPKQLHIALLGAMPRTHLQLTTPAALCLQVLSSGAASLVGLKQLPGAVARLQVVARRSVGGSGWCYKTMRAMSPRLRRTRALMPAVRRPRRRTVARHLMKTSRAQCVRC